MPITSRDIAEIHAHLSGLVGQEVWSPRLGVGSFITLEFGRRPTRETAQTGVAHGAWHLWIYCSAWRLDAATDIIAASEDPRQQLVTAVARLHGQRLSTASVIAPALELALTFSAGDVLRAFPVYSSGYEHWLLYTPDRHVLSAGPGASWSYTQAAGET